MQCYCKYIGKCWQLLSVLVGLSDSEYYVIKRGTCILVLINYVCLSSCICCFHEYQAIWGRIRFLQRMKLAMMQCNKGKKVVGHVPHKIPGCVLFLELVDLSYYRYVIHGQSGLVLHLKTCTTSSTILCTVVLVPIIEMSHAANPVTIAK